VKFSPEKRYRVLTTFLSRETGIRGPSYNFKKSKRRFLREMISNKQFRWSALLFSLLLFGLTIGASKRCAMVVETRGNNTLTVDDKSARMRTLQVLPAEAQVNVAEGAILRLSYFSSGKKEKITGPCSLRIGTGASELIE